MANDTESLDSLLDETLDDLADLPEFKPFPPGAHRAKARIELKTVNKHPSFELSLRLIEHVELADPAGETLEKGAETSTLFMRDNEIGQGKFKDLMKPLVEKVGTGNLKALIEFVNSQDEMLVVTKLRSDKNDKDKKYCDIVSLTPL